MPLGEYTVTLRITGSFRDARAAAVKIREIVQGAVSREQSEDREWQREHGGGGSLGWSASPNQIRRVEIS